jgi:tRNA-splicing ligase RtcB
MSRRQAAGRTRRRKREVDGRKVWVDEQLSPGRVDWPAVKRRLETDGIVLVGGGADEAPEVYKRLPDVLAAHGDTIQVKQRLRPIGVAMAGRDVFDPYRD